MTAIRNVVFDIGNVFVRWHTPSIVETAFGLSGTEAEARRHGLFVESDIWRALNRGEHTEAEAKRAYIDAGLLSEDEAETLFAAIYESLELMEDTPPLMEELAQGGYRLFALTDNVREIVSHLSDKHEWWSRFEGVSNSAEIGVLKPDPRMFSHVLETNGLVPEETVFFDDLPGNVAGAQEAGMHAFLFTDAAQARRDLATLGVTV